MIGVIWLISTLRGKTTLLLLLSASKHALIALISGAIPDWDAHSSFVFFTLSLGIGTHFSSQRADFHRM